MFKMVNMLNSSKTDRKYDSAWDNQISTLIKLCHQQAGLNLNEQIDSHFPQGQLYQLIFEQRQEPADFVHTIDKWHYHES